MPLRKVFYVATRQPGTPSRPAICGLGPGAGFGEEVRHRWAAALAEPDVVGVAESAPGRRRRPVAVRDRALVGDEDGVVRSGDVDLGAELGSNDGHELLKQPRPSVQPPLSRRLRDRYPPWSPTSIPYYGAGVRTSATGSPGGSSTRSTATSTNAWPSSPAGNTAGEAGTGPPVSPTGGSPGSGSTALPEPYAGRGLMPVGERCRKAVYERTVRTV